MPLCRSRGAGRYCAAFNCVSGRSSDAGVGCHGIRGIRPVIATTANQGFNDAAVPNWASAASRDHSIELRSQICQLGDTTIYFIALDTRDFGYCLTGLIRAIGQLEQTSDCGL